MGAKRDSSGVVFNAPSLDGELAGLIRERDWRATPLGASEAWPRSLHSYLSMILELPTAATIFWGPERLQLYNDSYADIMGPRHPGCLGAPFRDSWPEAYETIDPWMQRVLRSGQTVEVSRTLIPLARYGLTEDAYFTFSFSPLRDDESRIAGILQIVTDVTAASQIIHQYSGTNGRRRLGSSGENVAAMQPTAQRSEARVLIAEDHPDMREYLARLLSQRWRVDVAADGQAALRAAMASPPDLVLSDVMMPNLDGIGLVRALRAHPSTSAVPIILLSARSGEDIVVGGLDAGADDYLIKPFSARELIGRVRTHLEMARLRRKAVEAAQELAETRSSLLDDVERKNRELETFCFSVSHDLRAPIRAIEGFSRAVLEDHGEILGLDGKDSLERVIAAAGRMSRRVDDMLLLSRVELQVIARTSVDLSAVARQVTTDLASADRSRDVKISIADSLHVVADRGLMQILLDNVLGNAWKFTAKTAVAQIELGMVLAREPTYYVRDNGAGFDVANAARLFAPFQRYHSDRDFGGTGIGLATIRRIVERHDGRIWLESSVGGGTTVFWTLPDAVGIPGDGAHIGRNHLDGW